MQEYLAKETLDFLFPVSIEERESELQHLKGVIKSLYNEATQQHAYFNLSLGGN